MIEFVFYDSEDQDWHVIPVVALEQEICLVYMLQDPRKEGLHRTGLSDKQDTVLHGPVCSQRRRQVPLAGGMNTARIPICEQSAWFNWSSAALPRPWIKCCMCGNPKVYIFCSQQCPSLLFCFSSTICSSHLAEKLSISTWLLSFYALLLYVLCDCTMSLLNMHHWHHSTVEEHMLCSLFWDCQKHVFPYRLHSTTFLQWKVICYRKRCRKIIVPQAIHYIIKL